MPRSLLAQSAGLTSDTLEHPARTLRRIDQDDQWSDAHDTAETDDERDVVEEIVQRQDDLTIRPPKVSPTADNLKTHDMNTPSPTAPSPPSQNISTNDTDAGSVRSLPVVQITEPTSPTGMSPRSMNAAHTTSPTPSLAPPSSTSLDRRSTHRGSADVSAVPFLCFAPTLTDCARPVHQTVYPGSSRISSIDENPLHRQRESQRARRQLLLLPPLRMTPPDHPHRCPPAPRRHHLLFQPHPC